MENLQIPETLVDILKHNKRLRAPRFFVPERRGALRHPERVRHLRAGYKGGRGTDPVTLRSKAGTACTDLLR
jgi:hypothetical protein